MNRIIISLGAVLLFGNLSYGMNANAPDNSTKIGIAAASVITKDDYNDWFKAASDGDLDKLQSLIDKRIDVNCQDWIYTAMMCAAGAGRTSAVELLLANNASSSGALAFATRKGRTETAKLLLARGSKATEKWALSCAVVSGNIDTVRLLLENGANPNGDGYWNTPLIIAAEGQDWDIFQLLLKYKADPQVKNQRGYTVWDVAQRTRQYGIISGIIQCAQNNN
jgi:ankyrin repeat protein